jgi:hypothetical protein
MRSDGLPDTRAMLPVSQCVAMFAASLKLVFGLTSPAQVLDVSKFMLEHPGGKRVIMM